MSRRAGYVTRRGPLLALRTQRSHSLAQLTLIYDPDGKREHLTQAQLYSYRSLLLFRSLKESPLPYRESIRILRSLLNSMVVLVAQFEDHQGPGKRCILRRGKIPSEDYLEIQYEDSEESLGRTKAIKQLRNFVRQLGCIPLKTVEPGHGSSIHYASTLPFSVDNRPLTTQPSGRLSQTTGVYIGDGAPFTYLPAKGLTLTLMANANRVGHNIRRELTDIEDGLPSHPRC